MARLQLFLFMTKGMSLQQWRDLGMLERELALYRRLAPQLARVTIVSYGGREDARIIQAFPGIEVICKSWGLPQALYLRLLPFRLRRATRGPAIFKSNQVNGADLALKLARRLGAAFIARCGYLLSDFKAHSQGQASPEHLEAQRLEQQVFQAADHCVVTTDAMRSRLREYPVASERISVIPNYVDTQTFAPATSAADSDRRLVFIGRLEAQKNPLALLQAVEGLDVALDIVGAGSLRAALEAEAGERGVEARFHGNLSHLDLPAIIRDGAVFVLPSHYEGHPKTLLEAMSCGAAVIGTRVPGIEEVIRHQQTGWLCEPSVSDLREAIVTLLRDQRLRRSLGEAARAFVVAEYDLDRVVQEELAVYRQVMEGQTGAKEGGPCQG